MLLKGLQIPQQELLVQQGTKEGEEEVEVEVVVDQDRDVEVAQMDHKDQLHLQGDHTQLLQVVAKVLEELKDSEMMVLEQILATELQEAVGLEETPSVDTQEEMPEILILTV